MTTTSFAETSRLRDLVAGLSPAHRKLLATLLAESRAAELAPAPEREVGQNLVDRLAPGKPQPSMGTVQLSLFFFSEDAGTGLNKYRLLLEAAKLGDNLGFTSIWTPERHFDKFGGSYPNPALLASALAMVTRRIQLRAGSVVIPLHHPIRIAEEWSVVDNLSGGRVGIACATGWHLADFVLAPHQYDLRRDVTWQNLDIVQRLWRGEVVRFPGANSEDARVTIFPRPIQPALPVWVTASGKQETFRKAGQLGANLLTHLAAQSVDDLAEHIAIYRTALAERGHDPADYCVTVMLHTLVGDSDRSVKEIVRAPMYDYLRGNLGLHARQAQERHSTISMSQFTPDDEQAMLEHAFERYFSHSALFGCPATCLKMINSLKGAGVTEVACLVDFGVERERVLDGIRRLATLLPHPAGSCMDTHGTTSLFNTGNIQGGNRAS